MCWAISGLRLSGPPPGLLLLPRGSPVAPLPLCAPSTLSGLPPKLRWASSPQAPLLCTPPPCLVYSPSSPQAPLLCAPSPVHATEQRVEQHAVPEGSRGG